MSDFKNLITEWLEKIQKMSTDKKTVSGFEMADDQVLNEIRILARDGQEFIKNYWDDEVVDEISDRLKKRLQDYVANNDSTSDLIDKFVKDIKNQTTNEESKMSDLALYKHFRDYVEEVTKDGLCIVGRSNYENFVEGLPLGKDNAGFKAQVTTYGSLCFYLDDVLHFFDQPEEFKKIFLKDYED